MDGESGVVVELVEDSTAILAVDVFGVICEMVLVALVLVDVGLVLAEDGDLVVADVAEVEAFEVAVDAFIMGDVVGALEVSLDALAGIVLD